MPRFLLVLLILFGFQLSAQEKPEQAAEKSALAWLALVDAGKYEASWDEAAEIFKSKTQEQWGAKAKETWAERVKSVRGQTGKLKERKLKSAQYSESLPNAPAGKYVVIEYDSSFDSGSFIETAVPMQEKNGEWKISGYFVKPAQ